MRDPHVVSLMYRLKTDQMVSFDNPPPVQYESASFRVRLEGNELAVVMKDHFPDVRSARDVVDPWLQSWEIHSALEHEGQQQIGFDYEDAEIIDRDPPKPGELGGH